MTTPTPLQSWLDRWLPLSVEDPLERWHGRMHVFLSLVLLGGLSALAVLELVLRGASDVRTILAAVACVTVSVGLWWTRTTGRWRVASAADLVVVLGMLVAMDAQSVANDSAIAIAIASWVTVTGFVHGHGSMKFAAPAGIVALLVPRLLLLPGPLGADQLATAGGSIVAILVLAGTIWGAERSRSTSHRLAVRRAEAAEQAVQQAEQLAEAKSQFLATMSHEIRTPMNGVVNLTRLLEGSALDADQTQLVHTLSLSSEALLAVLNDVLDFSKIEAGQLNLEHVPVDVRAMSASVLALLQPGADEKGVSLSAEIDPSVARHVCGDPIRLRQLLTNLLSNAIKFTAEGEVVLRILRLEAGGLRILVQDTGIGIADDVLPTLFEPFTQADASTTRRFGGTGLGLAICKRLCDAMQGELSCETRLGEGSTFTVDLPLQESATPADREPVPRPADLNGLRVLVAEDNAVNQMVIQRLLERLGVQVQVVPDGRAAVQAVQESPFDLVLMDLHMPELDGLSATREICALPGSCARIPIVALTASALATDQQRCLEAGMVHHLSKPVDPDALAAVLHGLLRGERQAPMRIARG